MKIVSFVIALFSSMAFASGPQSIKEIDIQRNIVNESSLTIDLGQDLLSPLLMGEKGFSIAGWRDGGQDRGGRGDHKDGRHDGPPHRRHPGNSYYDWGKGQNGWGYCYQWTNTGAPLNEGKPVDNSYCERENPSQYNWGKGQNGWGYCYQWTPYGVALNQGQPVSNYNCERRRPSHYKWGSAKNGYTYCYQWTPDGVAMNEGKPVDKSYCE